MKLIHETPNGQFSFCPCNNTYKIEFGNIFLQFTPKELQQFREYLSSIDPAYYINLNAQTGNKRKLLLKIGSRNALFCLSMDEFNELNVLVQYPETNDIEPTPQCVEFNFMCN